MKRGMYASCRPMPRCNPLIGLDLTAMRPAARLASGEGAGKLGEDSQVGVVATPLVVDPFLGAEAVGLTHGGFEEVLQRGGGAGADLANPDRLRGGRDIAPDPAPGLLR